MNKILFHLTNLVNHSHVLISSTLRRKILLAYWTHGFICSLWHLFEWSLRMIAQKWNFKWFQKVTSDVMRDECESQQIENELISWIWNSVKTRQNSKVNTQNTQACSMVSDFEWNRSRRRPWCQVSSEIFQGVDAVGMFVLWNKFPTSWQYHMLWLTIGA